MSQEDQIQQLERRVQTLEDKEAIRNLKYQYAYSVDNKDWDNFLPLFTEDASIEFPQSAIDREDYHGTEGLEEFCAGLEDARQFMAHMMHNPSLSVDGDTAHGTWYFEVPEIVEDGSAVWVQGKYEEDYERVDGEWKFSTIHIIFHYNVDYDEGWEGAVETL